MSVVRAWPLWATLAALVLAGYLAWACLPLLGNPDMGCFDGGTGEICYVVVGGGR